MVILQVVQNLTYIERRNSMKTIIDINNKTIKNVEITEEEKNSTY